MRHIEGWRHPTVSMPVSTKTGSCRLVNKAWLTRLVNSEQRTLLEAVTPAVTANSVLFEPYKTLVSSGRFPAVFPRKAWCWRWYAKRRYASRCARNRRLARLWLAAKLAHKHPRGARLKIEPCNPLPERRHWLTAKAYFLNLTKPEIAAQRWRPAIEHKNSF